MGKCKLTIEQIISLYEEGKSTRVIAEKSNVSDRYIRMILNKSNINMRPHGSWKRKYSIKENYFQNWSNNMAYILGFIVADGTIARDAQFVSIAQKEKYILEEIKKEIGSNQPLYRNKHTDVYILNLNSKTIKSDLINIHGIKPNKTHEIKFPLVPDKYISHFIRGYFDGDGFVDYDDFTVSFVGGSRLFMEQLTTLLLGKGFSPKFVIENNYYRVHIRGRRSISLFGEWIYTDKGIYLKRKYNIFKKETVNTNLLKDRQNKNTKEAYLKRKMNFLVIYSLVNSIEYTCDCLGIKRTTTERWLREDPIFRESYNSL